MHASLQGEEDSPTYSPLSPNYRTADFTYRDSPLSPQQNRYCTLCTVHDVLYSALYVQ